MARARVVLPLCVALIVSLSSIPAPAASRIARTDGDDARGPLDLRSVVTTHAQGSSTFTVKTFGAFSNADVDGEDGLFEVDIDTNGDRKANYVVLVFHAAGRMRGLLLRPNGSLITRDLSAGRAGRNGVVVRVRDRVLGMPKSFDFAVFSLWSAAPCTDRDPCVDSIPNRYPLIRQDLTAPKVTLPPLPALSTDATQNVSFTVEEDRFGSGLDRWYLQIRRRGTSPWTTVADGRATSPTVPVTPGGGSWEVRVKASDRQGNVSISDSRFLVMPWDDADPSIVYEGAWTANTSVAGAFEGTTAVASSGSSFSLTVPTGNSLCILGGPADFGSASVVIDGQDKGNLSESSTTPMGTEVFCTLDLPETGSIQVEVTVESAEAVTIDGLYVTG